jgi:histidinol phosphatase-like enzyme
MNQADLDAKRQLAVDFDDTIATTIDGELVLIRGAREALERLRAHGYKIVIHSARAWVAWNDVWDRVGEMHDFLEKEGIPYDGIYMGNGKPAAVAYIDDRAMRFEDNWKEIADWLVFRKINE